MPKKEIEKRSRPAPQVAKRKRTKYRWAPRGTWNLSIKRIAESEGCYIHTDAVEILNQDIDWLIRQLLSISSRMLNESARQTYTRKIVRLAAAALLSDSQTLSKEALAEEMQVYQRAIDKNYIELE